MTKDGQSKKRTMNGFVIMYISIELKVLEIFIRPQKSWYNKSGSIEIVQIWVLSHIDVKKKTNRCIEHT